MKLTRIFTGEDNRSHFEDLEIPLAQAPYGRMSELVPAIGVIFRVSARQSVPTRSLAPAAAGSQGKVNPQVSPCEPMLSAKRMDPFASHPTPCCAFRTVVQRCVSAFSISRVSSPWLHQLCFSRHWREDSGARKRTAVV